MFKPNTSHHQTEAFAFGPHLSDRKRHQLEESAEYQFYQLIFRRIPEADFAVLYSEEGSRPNAPVNTMVAALILQHQRGWTYRELFKQIDFDLTTRVALGLWDLETTPFSPATLFNFQNRLAAHWGHTGENLLERVFDTLTQDQLAALELETHIQRADSFLAASNIREYSRLQLLIEVLQRFVRGLTDAEQDTIADLVEPYLDQSSGHYLYRLDADALPDALTTLGPIYQQLLQRFEDTYGATEIYQILQRVYTEHFMVVQDRVQVRPAETVGSDSLQSPDDPEATYRKKGSQDSRGQVIHVAETCHPDNQLNLITDVAVAPNNTDDSTILADRVEQMRATTPELTELHTDAGYASDTTDATLQAADITLIQTAIKGRTAAVPLTITPREDAAAGYQVTCPEQTVIAHRTPKRWKAEFDGAVCADCPVQAECPTTAGKTARRSYFDEDTAQRHARWKRWDALPEERRTLRPNVEATVREMQGAMPHKKLKVRGTFATATYAVLRAIGVNFGRITRFLADPDNEMTLETVLERGESLVWPILSPVTPKKSGWQWMYRKTMVFHPANGMLSF
jgi:hypothetical protein